MGKPLCSVSLIVKERYRNVELAATLTRHQSLAAARGEHETAEAAEQQLEELTEFPDDEDFAAWLVVPSILLPTGRSGLLPDNLQAFPTKLGKTAAEATKVAKQVLTLVYTAVRTAIDGNAFVPLPPECALEDPDLRQALIWPSMPIVEPDPEDRISNLIRTANPKWVPRDKLTKQQAAAYDECAAVVETAAYIYFWAHQGWLPELETEVED